MNGVNLLHQIDRGLSNVSLAKTLHVIVGTEVRTLILSLIHHKHCETLAIKLVLDKK
jgi:hypothetical protein